MKYILATIILILASTSAYSQMTGTWQRDWQSYTSIECSPVSFTIDNTTQNGSTVYTVSYNYSSMTGCSGNITGNYSSNLTLISTNVYNDSQSNQLTYDAINQVVYYLYWAGLTYMYDQNGSYISEQLALGPIGGVWTDGTFISSSNGSDASECCVPDSFFIQPSDFSDFDSRLLVTSEWSSNCTKRTSSFSQGLLIPTPSQLNWSAFEPAFNGNTNYILKPYASLNQITVQFTYMTGLIPINVCTYTYQKSTENVTLMNGNWKLDWQSTNKGGPSPIGIQVAIVDNSFMTSTLTYYTGTTSSYFIATGKSPNQYVDTASNLTFTYDNATNTLMTVSTSFYPYLLYSPNGSYVNDNMGDSYWDNPQSTDGTPLPSSCCLPTLAHIVPTQPSYFSITFNFSSDYDTVSGCEVIHTDIQNDQLEENLVVTSPPSLTLPSWYDEFNSTVSFASPLTTSELLISNFVNGGCTFKMSLTSKPNPNPNPPLYSSWMSIDMKSLIALVVVMISAYIN